ncbi:MAG: hypothetical protein GY804_07430 [Alphaproteobacteria bacterium]|nr:hypothetical protein [Alphaproteobacteria bacterium]
MYYYMAVFLIIAFTCMFALGAAYFIKSPIDRIRKNKRLSNENLLLAGFFILISLPIANFTMQKINKSIPDDIFALHLEMRASKWINDKCSYFTGSESDTLEENIEHIDNQIVNLYKNRLAKKVALGEALFRLTAKQPRLKEAVLEKLEKTGCDEKSKYRVLRINKVISSQNLSQVSKEFIETKKSKEILKKL